MYTYLLPCILIISTVAYFRGTSRANKVARASGGTRSLHSLPSHYGMLTALSGIVPALFIFMVWRIVEDTVITSLMTRSLSPEFLQLSANQLSLVLNKVKNVAFGGFQTHNTTPAIQAAADLYVQPEPGREI